MREVLGVDRGVQTGEFETPAMATETRRETRRSAEGDTRRATETTGRKATSAYGY
jgi:hypothetical protein